MYRYILVLLAGFCLTGSASASWADSLFDSVSRDFGSVPRGPVVTHHFRLVNNTRATVHLADVRVSCGCVTAYAMTDTLAPGQETAIYAQMDTRRFSGSRTVTIYVTFDTPAYAEVRLWVRANSREDINVYPETLALGHVKRGSSPMGTTRISLLGSSEYRILGVTSESNYVQPVCRMVQHSGHEVAYELTAQLRSDTPPGRWYTDVWVTTNNPTMPKVRVPLTVEVESTLSVSPSLVLMGNVKAGSEAVRKIIVRGVRPFRIVSVKGTDDQLRVHDDSQQKKMVHVLTVTVRPDQTGMLNRTLFVETDLQEENSIDFTARAQVVP